MPLIVSKTSNCHYGRENTKNMSLKCQIFPKRLTFNGVCSKYNCDVSIIIILGVLSAILPNIKCAKLENPQIRLLINDDELLQEKSNIHEAAVAGPPPDAPNSSGEHFNLYRSELKRLSYETIHRILRDENEPSYRREDTELRYYQKRSPSYEETHQLIKRSAASTNGNEVIIDLHHKNLTQLFLTPGLLKQLKVASVLDLSDNFLTQFNITSLHNVTSLSLLNLKNNSFTFIPLTEANTLRSLNLNHNLIKTSKLAANIYLRNLYLSYNRVEQVSSIDFSLLKNLESLDLSHNRLSNPEASFFTQRMHNLKHLNLAFNRLGSIYRETFYNLLSLNTLLLSHNNITDIDYETFLALPNLQYLDLSFNGLQGKSIRALQGITGLVALNIAFNPDIGPYMQEFVASWSLKELDASGTGLCQIPAALAQSVRSLKLTHNWLKIINCGDLDSYPLLQYLDLSFSHIEHIEDDALGRLEILEILMLDHNLLRKVPVSLPVSLEHLFLQHNDIMEITQLALQGLINLKTLDLSHNKLLYLPDIPLPKLQTLNLQSSQIRGISQGIIHSLPRLNDLMLEDNPIKCTDLLGIAEWASTCRLRVDKEEENDTEQDNFVIKVQDLKNKYERMHNFYEQFDLYTTHACISEDLKVPKCVKESFSSQPKKEMAEKLFENTKTMTTAAMPLAVKLLQVAAVRHNAETKSSSNKTDEVVEPVSKRSKEMEQQQLETVQQQGKSTMKTFQTTNKIKKWIKQETKTTSLARRAENKTTDVIAATATTTFTASISATTTTIPVTTTTTDTPNSTMAAAAVDYSTTTIVSQQQAAVNSSQQGERRTDGTIDKLLAINLRKKIQQPVPEKDIKTKIASAAKEIKSLATILNLKSMQTKITNKPTAKQAYPTTTTTTTAAISITEMTVNLDTQPLLATATTAGEEEDKQDFNATQQTTAAFLNTTNKIQEQTTTTKKLATAAYIITRATTTLATADYITTRATTTEEAAVAATVLSDIYKDKLKDLQSNYNSNDKNEQINAKILNKTNKNINSSLSMATATTTTPTEIVTMDSTNITTTSHSNNNASHTNAKIFDNLETMTTTTTTATELETFIETTSPATSNIISLENEQHLLKPTMEKEIDVNVKCTKQMNNSNECNEQQQHQHEDKAGRMPTMVATTLEKTTALETSTGIPAIATSAASSLTPVTAIHRHEPLQLLVKDRHLIGTPLLMHKGDNLMVTADELILPTNNISKSNNNNNSISHNGVQDVDDNRQHDLEEESYTTLRTDKTNKSYLETSQITIAAATTTMATPTFRTTLTTATNIRDYKQQPTDPIALAKDFGKSRKFSSELKTKKPSLIMKKMTIITKQHEQQHDMHNGLLLQRAIEPLENEVHAKQIDSSHYRELKPISLDHTLKHSTVNTPINSNSKRQASNLLKEPQTFQHEHELLIQQILQDQQAEGHQKLTKTEQWSDLRKAEHKENHPGLILLVSSGLFVVLLLGLMHVYRCDVPWRRHSPSHHLRPYQRPNSSFEDDSHSFLSYSEGMQKWHHSTRLEAPYNSPLHNLHVRELQKTSACEKPATVKSSATNFKPSLNRAILLNNTRSLSQSSTTTTSTASASSSAILDDESFYIEMTPDSGQMAQALQSELLPMELLNMKQLPTTVIDYQDTIADSQTSLEVDNTKHYQQQQLQHVRHQLESVQAQQCPSLALSAATSATGSATTNVISCSTTPMSVKAQNQSRKFGLW